MMFKRGDIVELVDDVLVIQRSSWNCFPTNNYEFYLEEGLWDLVTRGKKITYELVCTTMDNCALVYCDNQCFIVGTGLIKNPKFYKGVWLK